MIKPVYTIPETAPMKFYKFVTTFSLPVGIFMSIIQSFSHIASVSSNKLYLIDASFSIGHLVLLSLAWRHLRNMEWSGVRFYYADLLWSIGYNLLGICFSLVVFNSDIPVNNISSATAQVILLLLYWIYFSKRRLLFTPAPAYRNYPIQRENIENESASTEAPPIEGPSASKDISETAEPIEEISIPPEQMDTPQITPSSPPPNKGRLNISTSLFVLLLSALCISSVVIGYFCYSTGYKSGYGIGSESGYESGHKAGYNEGHNAGYTDAKSTYSKSINELKNEKNKLQSESEDLQDTINFYELVLDNIESEYWFYHDSAVIVTTTGNKYHQYGCPHLDGRRYYIYNIENAEYQGYTPCLDC